MYFRLLLFAESFIADGQPVSTFSTASFQYFTSVGGLHAGTEPVNVTATAPAWLICSFCHLGTKFIILSVTILQRP